MRAAIATLLILWSSATAAQPPAPIGEAVEPDMAVPVMINGQGPFPFAVDTGSTTTLISAELAERLGLPDGGQIRVHAMSGSARISTFTVDRLRLSTNERRDMRVAAVPRVRIGADGMVGLDMLRRQRMTMDFATRTITIEPSSAREEEPPRGTGEIVVIARERRGQLVMVDADADGQKVWVILDSGAQNSVGNRRLMQLLVKRRPQTEIKPIGMIDILGQVTPAEYVFVDRLRVGGVAMGHIAIAFADAHPFRLFGLTSKPALLLGMETLQAFSRVTIDFTTRKVTFQLPDSKPTAQ